MDNEKRSINNSSDEVNGKTVTINQPSKGRTRSLSVPDTGGNNGGKPSINIIDCDNEVFGKSVTMNEQSKTRTRSLSITGIESDAGKPSNDNVGAKTDTTNKLPKARTRSLSTIGTLVIDNENSRSKLLSLTSVVNQWKHRKLSTESSDIISIFAMHQAASEGDIDLVKRLVTAGAIINRRNKLEFTPLHLAARYGHTDVVTFLLENRAKGNMKGGEDEETPLLLAAKYVYIKLC